MSEEKKSWLDRHITTWKGVKIAVMALIGYAIAIAGQLPQTETVAATVVILTVVLNKLKHLGE